MTDLSSKSDVICVLYITILAILPSESSHALKKNNNFKTFGKTLLNFAILYMLQERNVLPLNSLGF